MTPAYPTTCRLTEEGALARLCAVYFVERAAAAVALAMLSPLMVVIGITICALSRRGPLVRHARAGWKGAPLSMLKFRTMWNRNEPPAPLLVVEDVSGDIPTAKNEPDARVSSSFAAFCRRYSLDEIPQLYHVVRGEMSLVGPRPITFVELKSHYGRCADEVLSVRPGLTGLWQIMGRNRLSYESRRRLDLMFVRRASAGLYLRILLQSVPRVLSGSDAR